MTFPPTHHIAPHSSCLLLRFPFDADGSYKVQPWPFRPRSIASSSLRPQINGILHFCVFTLMTDGDSKPQICFLDSQISADCLGLRLRSLEKRPDTTPHQPLSRWCTTANYSDKSLIVQLLQTTQMHLMQSVRGGGEWCITLSPMFVILSYKLFSRGVPSGGHYKVNWTYLQLSRRRYSVCVCGIMGWLLGWTFSISLYFTTDSVSEQHFVRCYSSERCVILRAMTAKTETALKRWRQGWRRRKGKAQLWRYENESADRKTTVGWKWSARKAGEK